MSTAPDAHSPKEALKGLLATYSAEVTARDRKSIEAAPGVLPRGTEVFIAAIPGESPDRLVAAAAQLRAGGFVPVPHIVARNLPDLKAVDELFGRMVGEAGVDRVLTLGGDRDRPEGELSTALQLIESGLIQKHGVSRIFMACYPEGHPRISDDALETARADKLAAARAGGLDVTLISQFCFDPQPIVGLARRMRSLGQTAPLRVGVAGPADRATLVKYALMCGVGASLRALKERQDLARNVMSGETPEALLTEVASAQAAEPGLGIEGAHFFTFGALAKSATWAEEARR